ncbi:MAG: ABC-F family ATP-binding cassette domain-containing protein [Erysipelothrix sp.]|jgi:ATP-binding cassette subfamily F protein 3|nr:ABC-F family ATP-binding cassette domain-containing protein [Erysipelothrix sp.]
MIISLSHISKSYPSKDILSDVSLMINKKEKVAIIGLNGSGKTTLLNIISKELTPDSGDVFYSGKIVIQSLKQHAFENEDLSVQEVFEQSMSKVVSLEKQLTKLQHQVSNHPEDGKLLSKLANLQHEFEELGGYHIQSIMETMLTKMGFSKDVLSKSIHMFSQGQKTRLALASLLLSYPDVLILDEPTNHLDIDMIEWLEGFLVTYPKTIIFVSHDRRFIDKVATDIVEIEYEKVTQFKGNYSSYQKAKAKMIEKLQSAYHRQQKDIERLEELIEKFRYKRSKAAFAQSKIKYLERMDRIDAPKKSSKAMTFSFNPYIKGGKEVMVMSQAAIGYDSILHTLDLTLLRGQRVAVVGKNGVGKSTLLKTIASEIPLLGGEFIFGHQIQVAYFDQNHAQLNSSKLVIEELWDEHPQLDHHQIRSILAQFLFTQDDVFKAVSACSGGERVRLSLAKIMLKRTNLLLLDEPTNHLDIPAKEALEDALISYTGTILFVSHDRYFIDKVSTAVLTLDEHSGQLVTKQVVSSNVEVVDEVKEQRVIAHQERKALQKSRKQKEKRIQELEKLIHDNEQQLETLRDLRFDPEYYHDFSKMEVLNAQIDDQHNVIAKFVTEWETLSLEIEEGDNND